MVPPIAVQFLICLKSELFGCSIIRSVGSFSLLPAEPAGCHFHVPGGSCDLWRAFALIPSQDGKEHLAHFMQFFNQKLEKSCAESPYLIIQPHSGFLFCTRLWCTSESRSLIFCMHVFFYGRRSGGGSPPDISLISALN